MDVQEVVEFAQKWQAAIATGVAIGGAVISWKPVQDIRVSLAQLRPNGGTSLHDKVTSIDNRLCKLESINLADFQDDHEMRFYSDKDGLCEIANTAYLTTMKRQLYEVTGHSWPQCIYEDDREMVIRKWDAAVKDKRSFHLEYRMVDRDQNIIHVMCDASMMVDLAGVVQGWKGVITKKETPNPVATAALTLGAFAAATVLTLAAG
jgi:PAS domain-containing protein